MFESTMPVSKAAADLLDALTRLAQETPGLEHVNFNAYRVASWLTLHSVSWDEQGSFWRMTVELSIGEPEDILAEATDVDFIRELFRGED
jgi:hypothetical protein